MSETGTVEDLQLEVFIEAEPADIFPFLTDPERMGEWFGEAEGLDARPGGLFRVNVGGRHTARGSYSEVQPNRRVAFTFGWEGEGAAVPPGSSTVVIDLEPQTGGTLVRLTHSGLSRTGAESHGHGWRHYLRRLKLLGEGRDPGPDRGPEN